MTSVEKKRLRLQALMEEVCRAKDWTIEDLAVYTKTAVHVVSKWKSGQSSGARQGDGLFERLGGLPHRNAPEVRSELHRMIAEEADWLAQREQHSRRPYGPEDIQAREVRRQEEICELREQIRTLEANAERTPWEESSLKDLREWLAAEEAKDLAQVEAEGRRIWSHQRALASRDVTWARARLANLGDMLARTPVDGGGPVLPPPASPGLNVAYVEKDGSEMMALRFSFAQVLLTKGEAMRVGAEMIAWAGKK